MTTLLLHRNEPWHLGFCHEKLQLRGQLPGASIFDKCCHAQRTAKANGIPTLQRLWLATPAGWMVNSPTTSPVLQQWLTGPQCRHWLDLIRCLDTTSDDWPNSPHRNEIAELVDSLYIDGVGLTGLSKILAQLCPETIPLMDDAALWFALGTPLPPHNPNKPHAPSSLFLPMIDWFTAAVRTHNAELTALAETYPLGTFTPAQVLDRLLWFESWGYHILPPQDGIAWRWVANADASREAIIPVQLFDALPASFTQRATQRQPWPKEAPDTWRDAVDELLDCVYQEVGAT